MIVTVLEARVAADKWNALTEAYEKALTALDPGIEETFLAHGLADPAVWSIFTVWRDRNALNAIRDSGETPRGILIFRSADAEPTLALYNIAAHAVA
jgi:heme-degrading monooxygenase HmoA